jgi:large subunit ribosomal protein L28
MSKRCQLTGRGIQTGNNVSHAKNRTRRRFLPNLQNTSLWSEALREPVRLKVSAYALRTVEHKGGLDAFLMDARTSELAPEARKVKRRLKKVLEKAAA